LASLFIISGESVKNNILLAGILLLVSGGLAGQCKPEEIPFRNGEKITWGPVWVDAGEVTFSVEKAEYRGQAAFHFISTGSTYKGYDFLFKVRDYYDSWVDPVSFRSFEFRRQINEGGYVLFNGILFFNGPGYALSNTKRPDKPIKTDTIKIRPCLFDMLSSVYYVRSLDLNSMKENAVLPVEVLIDDSVFHINVKKLGKEVKENRDGTRYPCIKLSATMVEGTIFKKDEEALIWITDDTNKVPIIVEAKIIVGTVKAYLKEAQGLLKPLTTSK
jgi:hypothetical protein